MGKVVDTQGVVVASTATEWHGHEGDILRYVFWNSVALACLVGVLSSFCRHTFPLLRICRPMRLRGIQLDLRGNFLTVIKIESKSNEA